VGREIERKFLVKQLPSNLNLKKFDKILQGYLDVKNKNFEVRFRKKGDHYYQTIKQGNGLNREEIEVELTKGQFVNFWPLTAGMRIVKRRYEIPQGNHIIELDVYEDRFNGLIACEVEFESEPAARAFDPPEWFGTEITEEHALQNNHLAQKGLSKELIKKYDLKIYSEDIFQQSGVIPLRQKKSCEALIITTGNQKSWIFPKGIVEYGMSPEKSAVKEAFEEAGIFGEITEKIGSYSYQKWNGTCKVEMFLFEKVKSLKRWPEDFRNRKWVKVADLQLYIKKPELQPIIKLLQKKFKLKRNQCQN
jgi:CYTH domain-containing protein/8-oxo-dGTP pyrophosphatase MutT (NUDIX family)